MPVADEETLRLEKKKEKLEKVLEEKKKRESDLDTRIQMIQSKNARNGEKTDDEKRTSK